MSIVYHLGHLSVVSDILSRLGMTSKEIARLVLMQKHAKLDEPEVFTTNLFEQLFFTRLSAA